MNARNHLGLLGGAALVLAVGAGIWLGSHGLRHFDPAVIGYAIGTLLAAFAVGYRFVTWAQRPPSRMYFKRGLQLLFQRVAQTSKSAVSRVSKPAARPLTDTPADSARAAGLETGDTAGLETCATTERA